MAFHVSTCMSLQDTWQAMCQLAWNMQVSINRGVRRRRRGKQERKREREEKRKEREKIKIRKEKGKKKEKEKGGQQFLPQFIGIPKVRTRRTKE